MYLRLYFVLIDSMIYIPFNIFCTEYRGREWNRTAVEGFADPYLATRTLDHLGHTILSRILM